MAQSMNHIQHGRPAVAAGEATDPRSVAERRRIEAALRHAGLNLLACGSRIGTLFFEYVTVVDVEPNQGVGFAVEIRTLLGKVLRVNKARRLLARGNGRKPHRAELTDDGDLSVGWRSEFAKQVDARAVVIALLEQIHVAESVRRKVADDCQLHSIRFHPVTDREGAA